jgi:hypothetical protein
MENELGVVKSGAVRDGRQAFSISIQIKYLPKSIFWDNFATPAQKNPIPAVATGMVVYQYQDLKPTVTRLTRFSFSFFLI